MEIWGGRKKKKAKQIISFNDCGPRTVSASTWTHADGQYVWNESSCLIRRLDWLLFIPARSKLEVLNLSSIKFAAAPAQLCFFFSFTVAVSVSRTGYDTVTFGRVMAVLDDTTVIISLISCRFWLALLFDELR